MSEIFEESKDKPSSSSSSFQRLIAFVVTASRIINAKSQKHAEVFVSKIRGKHRVDQHAQEKAIAEEEIGNDLEDKNGQESGLQNDNQQVEQVNTQNNEVIAVEPTQEQEEAVHSHSKEEQELQVIEIQQGEEQSKANSIPPQHSLTKKEELLSFFVKSKGVVRLKAVTAFSTLFQSLTDRAAKGKANNKKETNGINKEDNNQVQRQEVESEEDHSKNNLGDGQHNLEGQTKQGEDQTGQGVQQESYENQLEVQNEDEKDLEVQWVQDQEGVKENQSQEALIIRGENKGEGQGNSGDEKQNGEIELNSNVVEAISGGNLQIPQRGRVRQDRNQERIDDDAAEPVVSTKEDTNHCAQAAVIIHTESEPDTEREDERKKEDNDNSHKICDNEDNSKNEGEFLEDQENVDDKASEGDVIEQNEQQGQEVLRIDEEMNSNVIEETDQENRRDNLQHHQQDQQDTSHHKKSKGNAHDKQQNQPQQKKQQYDTENADQSSNEDEQNMYEEDKESNTKQDHEFAQPPQGKINNNKSNNTKDNKNKQESSSKPNQKEISLNEKNLSSSKPYYDTSISKEISRDEQIRDIARRKRQLEMQLLEVNQELLTIKAEDKQQKFKILDKSKKYGIRYPQQSQSNSIPIKEQNQVRAMIEISDNKKAREDAVTLVRRMNAQRKLKEKAFLDRLTHVKGKITEDMLLQREERYIELSLAQEQERKNLVIARMQEQELKKLENQRLRDASKNFVKELSAAGPREGQISSHYVQKLHAIEMNSEKSLMQLKAQEKSRLPLLQQRKRDLYNIRSLAVSTPLARANLSSQQYQLTQSQKQHHNQNLQQQEEPYYEDDDGQYEQNQYSLEDNNYGYDGQENDQGSYNQGQLQQQSSKRNSQYQQERQQQKQQQQQYGYYDSLPVAGQNNNNNNNSKLKYLKQQSDYSYNSQSQSDQEQRVNRSQIPSASNRNKVNLQSNNGIRYDNSNSNNNNNLSPIMQPQKYEEEFGTEDFEQMKQNNQNNVVNASGGIKGQRILKVAATNQQGNKNRKYVQQQQQQLQQQRQLQLQQQQQIQYQQQVQHQQQPLPSYSYSNNNNYNSEDYQDNNNQEYDEEAQQQYYD